MIASEEVDLLHIAKLDAVEAFERQDRYLAAAAILWCSSVLVPAKRARASVEELQWLFSDDSGHYIVRCALAGALLAAGFSIGYNDVDEFFVRARPRSRRWAPPLVVTLSRVRETMAHASEDDRRAFVALLAAVESDVGASDQGAPS